MGRAFSVMVGIGARLLPSLGAATSKVERQFAKMNRSLRVQALETRLAYKDLMSAAKPMVGLAAAGGLSFGLKGIFTHGAEYAHEIASLRIVGRTHRQVAQAIAQANKTIADVPTSTLADNLKIINETTGAYGSFAHALENLNFNSKLGFMMTNLLGKDPSEVPSQLQAGIRALEIRGSAMKAEVYQREMGELFRAMAFFKGAKGGFNAEELAAFSQTGNMPIKLYNERFLTKILPSLITEAGGGDIVGTQAAAFRNQIMGRVPIGGKKLTEEWVRLGLVPPAGTGGNMSKTGWTAGSVKGHELAMRDPFSWIETVLLPAMKAKGVNTDDTLAVSTQISKMFGRETSMRFVSMMADPLQRARLHKDEGYINKALPLEDSYKLMLATDPNAAYAKFMASWENLQTNIGKALTPNIISALNSAANAVNWLAGAFDRHPNFAKGVTALMGFGAAAAGLSILRIGLGFLLKPLGLLFELGGRLLGLLPRLGNVMLAFFRKRIGMGLVNGLARVLGGLGRGLGAIGRLIGPLLARGLSGLGPLLARGFAGLGPALLRGLAALGPLLWRGIMLVGPWLLRGLLVAFGYLSNPAGWALLAATAIALIWTFRKQIASAWNNYVVPFFSKAWAAVKNYVGSIDWGDLGLKVINGIAFGLAFAWTKIVSWHSAAWNGLINWVRGLNWSGAGQWVMSTLSTSLFSGWGAIKSWWEGGWPALINWVKSLSWSDVGMWIADRLTFGLASKINGANWGGIIKGAVAAGKSAFDGWGAGAAAANGSKAAPAAAGRPGPALAPFVGKRALGGPVRAGSPYLVGERGQEIFTPSVSGLIIPASATERILRSDSASLERNVSRTDTNRVFDRSVIRSTALRERGADRRTYVRDRASETLRTIASTAPFSGDMGRQALDFIAPSWPALPRGEAGAPAPAIGGAVNFVVPAAPGAPGIVIPPPPPPAAGASAARQAMELHATIVVQGAQDPGAVAREVRAEFERMARRQDALMSD